MFAFMVYPKIFKSLKINNDNYYIFAENGNIA